jgi:TetR/AcrR family transcriptional repressor of nem operon
MARNKEFDDDAAVRAARDVFWRHGYASTSLSQLQQETGLNKSSLYQSYGSKRGLFERAVGSYLDEVIDPLLHDLEAPGAGAEELAAYFESLAQLFRTAPPEIADRGCLLLNTAMELNDLDAEAAKAVAAYRGRVRAAFFGAARASTSDIAEAERRADLLTASHIGMMVTSRVDPATAAALADTLAAEARANA